MNPAQRPAIACPSGVVAVVRTVVNATVKLHAMAPGLHRVLSEQSGRLTPVRALAAPTEQHATRWWERYLRSQRQLAIRDPALTAAMVFGTIESAMHKVVIHGDGTISLDRHVDELVTLVVGLPLGFLQKFTAFIPRPRSNPILPHGIFASFLADIWPRPGHGLARRSGNARYVERDSAEHSEPTNEGRNHDAGIANRYSERRPADYADVGTRCPDAGSEMRGD